MLNWNTDEKKFKKFHPNEYTLWRIIQRINYGIDDDRLDEQEVRDAWPTIKDRLNPDRRKVLEFYLWNKKWRQEPGLLPDRSNYWILRHASHTSHAHFT